MYINNIVHYIYSFNLNNKKRNKKKFKKFFLDPFFLIFFLNKI